LQHRQANRRKPRRPVSRYSTIPDLTSPATSARRISLLLVKMKSQSIDADNMKSVTDCIIVQFS
jgi:hypothetical protein